MARWKLVNPHYLNTADPVKWEYQETDRGTGKLVRRLFNVPRYIDPRDPTDWTNKWGSGSNQDGEVIVCFPGRGDPKDIEFEGDPTPDMIPVDDEAREITHSFEARWSYKPEEGNVSHSQSLVDTFQMQLADIQAASAPVKVEGLDTLVAAMAAQTEAISKALINRKI